MQKFAPCADNPIGMSRAGYWRASATSGLSATLTQSASLQSCPWSLNNRQRNQGDHICAHLTAPTLRQRSCQAHIHRGLPLRLGLL